MRNGGSNYDEHLDQFIGGGGGFEYLFDEVRQDTRKVKGVEKINNSIKMILSTRKGERWFLPKFGSDLHKCIFEPNRHVLADMIKYYITEALTEWEPRITLQNIEVETVAHGNTIPVHINYRIKNSNVVYSYVYPFNRTSGGIKSHEI